MADWLERARQAGARATRVLPCQALADILLPAFTPCHNFAGPCMHVATWNPDTGHVPRGFVGALGESHEVQLVLLTAEPGDPLAGERYDGEDPAALLKSTCELAYGILSICQDVRDRNLIFHRNVRRLLDLCWPGATVAEQLRRTWIVDSYLCSAPVESGPVVRASWSACTRDYLRPQLDALPEALVVALGGKAHQRARSLGVHASRAYSVAPPGANRKAAVGSWEAVAAEVHRRSMT